MNDELTRYISQIKAADRDAMKAAQERLDSLVKPPGSLGALESIAVALAGMSGKVVNDVSKRCVVVMSSDNGVVEEGVSSAPQSVTCTQTVNFVKGLTGVAVLAKLFHADLIVVDVGVNADLEHPLIVNRKIRKSTWNIAKQDAMTYGEAERAVLIGVETAIEAVENGYAMIGVGDMGIGNTTTSSAVLCAMTGLSADLSAGKGAGLDVGDYRHKIEVIKTALQNNKPDPSDPVDVLAKVGGFDIAAMAGVYIGAAYKRVPAVIDGFISTVAALAAYRLSPIAREYMLPSHASFEQGYSHASLIGTHWFQWIDQPNTGRGDGENYNIGFVDITDRPYPDMVEAMKTTFGRLYDVHSGKMPPYDVKPKIQSY